MSAAGSIEGGSRGERALAPRALCKRWAAERRRNQEAARVVLGSGRDHFPRALQIARSIGTHASIVRLPTISLRAEMASVCEAMVRDAGPDDLPVVAACLASAFYEDPLWGHWTFPDESRRERDLLPFMTLQAQLAVPNGWIAMTAGGESVAVWTPPGASYGLAQQEPLVSEVLDRLFGGRAAAIHELFNQFEEHVPAGHFYHLEWWSTHRRHAGRGFGASLIAENLARVDAEHLPSYLESTNPINLQRYETLGFRRIGEFSPPAGPIVTTMWREAR